MPSAQSNAHARRHSVLGLTLGLSLLVMLVICEFGLRLLVPATRYLPGYESDFWLAQRGGEGCIKATGDVEDDPQLGWRSRHDYHKGGTSHDANGFRPARELDSTRADDRIFVIGDSFTYGLRIDDEYVFSAQLEERTGSEVINAGVNGYGLDQALLRWESQGWPLHPHHVIAGYYTHDFHRNALGFLSFHKPRFVKGTTGEDYTLEMPPACEDLPERGFSLRTAEALRFSWRRLRNYLGWLPLELLEERAELSRYLLKRLDSSVRESGGELLVLIIPHCSYPADGHYGEWVAARIADDCRELDIPVLDLTREMDPAMFATNCHWSQFGHARVAELIDEELKKH